MSPQTGKKNATAPRLKAFKTIRHRYPGNTAVSLGRIIGDSAKATKPVNGGQVFPGRESGLRL